MTADGKQQPAFKTTSQRIAEAMGRPVTPPPSEEERLVWEAELDRVDEEIRRYYGKSDAA